MTDTSPSQHTPATTPPISADTTTAGSPPAAAALSFSDFGVDDAIVASLTAAGITSPFPIQEVTLPLALSGADLIGQARTGTGKTLAFGVPLLQRVDAADRRTQALVIVPTRELCLQVRDDLGLAGARKGVEVLAAYGGRAIEPQIESLRTGAPVVVGTPGRLLDLMRRGDLDLSTVTGLVLDEADEMLDLGFLPDVEVLLQACAEARQTMLFSATMPSPVVALARRYMRKPTFLRADVEEVRIAPETAQHFFSCHRMDKPAVLARILQAPDRGLCVVFSRTKRMADILAEELRGLGIEAAPLHSDLRQEARERALARFRQGTIDVLVATEVAARGLDISDVTHVVNYDCPDDEKMYLHRIGRTGRAGAAGVAITFALWNELARLEMIKKALGITSETVEVFSTSPLLDELFALPPREPRHSQRQPGSRRGIPRGDGRRAGEPSASPETADATAADQPTAADEPTAAESGRGAGRRRGRRGRGGRRRVDAAGDTTTLPSPSPATSASTLAQPAAGADTGTPEQAARPVEEAPAGDAAAQPRRRVRTRGRAAGAEAAAGHAGESASGADADAGSATGQAPPADVPPAAAASAAVPEAEPRDEAPIGGPPPAVHRVRTRRRDGRAALPQAPEDADTPSGAPGPAAAEPGRQPAPPAAERRGGKQPRRSPGSASSRRGSQRRRSGRPERGRSADRSSEPITSRSAVATRRVEPPADGNRQAVEVIRDSGKPALQRPLVIVHLP